MALALWLCGSVALWRCGAVAVWLCDCGSVDLQLRCYAMALWLCGSVALWLWLCRSASVALWLHLCGCGCACVALWLRLSASDCVLPRPTSLSILTPEAFDKVGHRLWICESWTELEKRIFETIFQTVEGQNPATAQHTFPLHPLI